MNYELVFTPSYEKRAARFLRRHPDVVRLYEKTLRLVEVNPAHPSLRLHRLKGRLSDLHSVSINISYRITIEFLVEGQKIIPIDVGTHDEVYGK
jgi:mRNA-degrading endonuclease YafQ of YafQ-DinJ toxin-antitoxin module